MLPPDAILEAIRANHWTMLAGRVASSPVTATTYDPSTNSVTIHTTRQLMRVVVPSPSSAT